MCLSAPSFNPFDLKSGLNSPPGGLIVLDQRYGKMKIEQRGFFEPSVPPSQLAFEFLKGGALSIQGHWHFKKEMRGDSLPSSFA